MEPWPRTIRERETCWHAALSCLLPWCLWSAACHRLWTARPCYCNAIRLWTHVCRKKKDNKYKYFPCSVTTLLSWLSVCLPVCVVLCRSVSLFVSLSRLFCCQNELLFSFQKMAIGLMLKHYVWFIVLRVFCHDKEQSELEPTGLSVIEPCCCRASPGRPNMQISGKILLISWLAVHLLQESEVGALLVWWMDYWLGKLGTGPGLMDRSPCEKWCFFVVKLVHWLQRDKPIKAKVTRHEQQESNYSKERQRDEKWAQRNTKQETTTTRRHGPNAKRWKTNRDQLKQLQGNIKKQPNNLFVVVLLLFQSGVMRPLRRVTCFCIQGPLSHTPSCCPVKIDKSNSIWD